MADFYTPGAELPSAPPGSNVQDMVTALKNLGAVAQQAPITGPLIRGFTAAHDALNSTPENPYTTDKAMHGASDMMSWFGTGAPAAQEGAAGIFGGRVGGGRDMRKGIEKALSDYERGVNPEQSLAEGHNGWFVDPKDRRLKFEINDQDAAIKEGFSSNPFKRDEANFWLPLTKAFKMGDVFEHPELYKHYPDIANMKVSRELTPEYGGAYYPNTDEIKIKAYAPMSDARNTILHELQHAVQRREGFDRGSHWQNFYPEGYKELKNTLADRTKSVEGFLDSNGMWGKGALRNAMSYAKGGPHDAENLNSLIDLMHRTGKAGDFANYLRAMRVADTQIEQPAKMQYFMSPGEVEARNVEYRSDFSPLERILNTPWNTSDLLVKALQGQTK